MHSKLSAAFRFGGVSQILKFSLLAFVLFGFSAPNLGQRSRFVDSRFETSPFQYHWNERLRLLLYGSGVIFITLFISLYLRA